MRTIYKYRLVLGGGVIRMPKGSRVLSVGVQGGDLFVWADVDTDVGLAPRLFVVVGTGHPMPVEPGEFVGSVHVGPFVWHVFDQGEEAA